MFMIDFSQVTDWMIFNTNIVKVEDENTIIWMKQMPDMEGVFYIKNISDHNAKFKIGPSRNGSQYTSHAPLINIHIKYSSGGSGNFDVGGPNNYSREITVYPDETIELYQYMSSYAWCSSNTNYYLKFTNTAESDGCFEIGGNISALLGDTLFNGNYSIPAYGMYHTFDGFTGLANAENLLFRTVGHDYSYDGMFSNCTNLITGPKYGFGSTVGNYCCASMFSNCSSMTTCDSIIGISGTSNTATASHKAMFSGCSSLTRAKVTINFINEKPIECIDRMFNGCSSLNKIYVGGYGRFEGDYIMLGTDSNGKCYKLSQNVTLARGVDGIPSGWTVVEQ